MLPGNAFTLPLPDWLTMRDVPLLAVQEPWDRWKRTAVVSIVGIVLALAIVLWISQSKPSRFFCIKVESDTVALYHYSSKGTALLSVLGLLLLVPVYYTGSNYYECGSFWLSLSLAHLSGAPVCEFLIAAFVCAWVALTVLGVHKLEVRTREMRFDVLHHDPDTGNTGRCVALLLGWATVVCVFSMPSVVYAASASLPSENTLGLKAWTIEVAQYFAGVALFVISAYLVPNLSRKASRWAGAGSKHTGLLIMSARFVITLLAPFFTVLTLDQDCFANWLLLWPPCQQSSRFDMAYTKASTGTCTSSVPCLYSSPDFTPTAYDQSFFLRHADVCTPRYVPDGRCPRTVVEIIGGLLAEKLCFGACVAPGIALLLSSQHVYKTRLWLTRRVLCKPEDYEPKTSLDVEMASVVMLLEIPLVIGFCVPVLVPLACMTLTMHTRVFQWSVLKLQHQQPPSILYLWNAIGLGWGLVAWFYHESQLYGVWVVLCAPLVGIGVFLGLKWRDRRNLAARDPEDRKCATMIKLEMNSLGRSVNLEPKEEEDEEAVPHDQHAIVI